MDKEELLRRKELAMSEEYAEIKARILSYMVSKSTSPNISPECFKNWLVLLHFVDGWIDDCNIAIEKEHKKKEN